MLSFPAQFPLFLLSSACWILQRAQRIRRTGGGPNPAGRASARAGRLMGLAASAGAARRSKGSVHGAGPPPGCGGPHSPPAGPPCPYRGLRRCPGWAGGGEPRMNDCPLPVPSALLTTYVPDTCPLCGQPAGMGVFLFQREAGGARWLRTETQEDEGQMGAQRVQGGGGGEGQERCSPASRNMSQKPGQREGRFW